MTIQKSAAKAKIIREKLQDTNDNDAKVALRALREVQVLLAENGIALADVITEAQVATALEASSNARKLAQTIETGEPASDGGNAKAATGPKKTGNSSTTIDGVGTGGEPIKKVATKVVQESSHPFVVARRELFPAEGSVVQLREQNDKVPETTAMLFVLAKLKGADVGKFVIFGDLAQKVADKLRQDPDASFIVVHIYDDQNFMHHPQLNLKLA